MWGLVLVYAAEPGRSQTRSPVLAFQPSQQCVRYIFSALSLLDLVNCQTWVKPTNRLATLHLQSASEWSIVRMSADLFNFMMIQKWENGTGWYSYMQCNLISLLILNCHLDADIILWHDGTTQSLIELMLHIIIWSCCEVNHCNLHHIKISSVVQSSSVVMVATVRPDHLNMCGRISTRTAS